MNGHAILSASGAHRWMNCTPSARLEREFADTSGEAAAEGTAAHALAEHKLRKALKLRSKRPVSEYDSEEMEAHIDGYVDFVLEVIEGIRQSCRDPIVLIEQRLDFSNFVPDGFGTGDCLVIGDGVLHIIDLKYGQGVLVHAEDNPQLMLYSLGALEVFDRIYDINEVAMSIYQPRRENVSTHVMFKDSLFHWAEEILIPVASLAFNGDGEYRCGEWCQFCRAAVKCRARAEDKLNLAKFEFTLPPLLSDADIADILVKLDDLTSWANDIKAYALEAALYHGKHWSGFKLVEGRSIRKFKDEDAVADAAKSAGYRDIYHHSLITLTEMEKLMSKAKFNEILGSFIEKPPGKPTLVPLSDKRPEINSTALQDFMEEI